ncbi:SDR family oxidoreductase [Fuerstiella marisgermanici]|uniref:1-deoxy-11-beta-hydroxypentalenate dehydrogenase n=1 Tax=Fuerstiella marisgermanici TaxID=1891926 RepID=A0A1P8WA44_9PLAN|nr:SDR family oxidoreductase [Fuerstiella marisgermanici]APZ90927.1 1-deoxy-11-beta-hydroxypentalenate dehydrogenase [Fuerstiella marisgermanici]
MELREKVVVVTGGGNGIGAALCRRFAAEQAAKVVVSDIDMANAEAVAKEIGGLAIQCDVADESSIQALVKQTVDECGRIDVFCSNAGITVKGGIESPNEDWMQMWDVNVMSRLYAARAVVPMMLEQGSGYLVHTASAAGVLTEIGSASYSVTKHADVALAEWLSVCYGRQGINVSCVCPLGVTTDFLDNDDPIHRYLHLHAITADDVAESVVNGMREKQFLILPHPEVAEFFSLKTDDHDRWIRGMQRLRQKLTREMKKRDAA